jgi:hypothetical protein
MFAGIWSGKFNLQAGHWPEVTQLLNASAHKSVQFTLQKRRFVFFIAH